MTFLKCVRYILLVILCVTQVSQQAFCEVDRSPGVTPGTLNESENIKKAKEKLKKLGREAIDSLAAGQLAGQGLHSKFIELYQRDFAQEKIASLILVSHWRKMNASQKKRFLDVLPKKLANIYSSKFHEYQGVDFRIIRGWINNHELQTIVITTIIQKPGGRPLNVNWYLTAEEKIYDIVVEGISMVKTFRDQYLTALNQRKNDIDAFLDRLDNVVSGPIAGPAPGPVTRHP